MLTGVLVGAHKIAPLSFSILAATARAAPCKSETTFSWGDGICCHWRKKIPVLALSPEGDPLLFPGGGDGTGGWEGAAPFPTVSLLWGCGICRARELRILAEPAAPGEQPAPGMGSVRSEGLPGPSRCLKPVLTFSAELGCWDGCWEAAALTPRQSPAIGAASNPSGRGGCGVRVGLGGPSGDLCSLL